MIETDLITFPKQEQIEKLNEAKASKKTGEFELTFAAPDGTEATVTVYLTEEGLDGAAQGSGKPSCGADSVSHPTGGNSFGEEDGYTQRKELNCPDRKARTCGSFAVC